MKYQSRHIAAEGRAKNIRIPAYAYTNIPEQAVSLHLLIKSRFLFSTVRGRTLNDIQKQLGVSDYIWRKNANILIKEKLLRKVETRNGIMFIARSYYDYAREHEGFVDVMTLWNFDTFETIKFKYNIFRIRTVINATNHVRESYNTNNAYCRSGTTVKEVKSGKKALAKISDKYGPTVGSENFIGLRRLSQRTGIGTSTLSSLIRKMVIMGIVDRKFITQTYEKRFVLAQNPMRKRFGHKIETETNFTLNLGTNYSFMTKSLFCNESGLQCSLNNFSHSKFNIVSDIQNDAIMQKGLSSKDIRKLTKFDESYSKKRREISRVKKGSKSNNVIDLINGKIEPKVSKVPFISNEEKYDLLKRKPTMSAKRKYDLEQMEKADQELIDLFERAPRREKPIEKVEKIEAPVVSCDIVEDGINLIQYMSFMKKKNEVLFEIEKNKKFNFRILTINRTPIISNHYSIINKELNKELECFKF